MTGVNSSLLKLAKRNNYLNKSLKYIKNTVITEYDMESAGMNILTELGYFTSEQRKKLILLNKKDRNITIGKILQKDKEMVTALEDGFIKARYTFLEKNNIDPSDVLSIKRDAIFIIGNYIIDKNISDLIKIRPKGKFTCYMNILNREHYYNTDNDNFDVKGYGKEAFKTLDDNLFVLLREILKFDIMRDKDSIYLKLVQFKDDLLSYNLPKEYFYDPLLEGYIISSHSSHNHYILPDIESKDKFIISYHNVLRFINEIIKYVL